MAKGSRYTIGARIENKFIDLLELSYIAYFTPLEAGCPKTTEVSPSAGRLITGLTSKEKKEEKISECILVLDTLKFLISIAWEGKIISNKQYEDIAMKLEEVGKMFGGWRNSLKNTEKKNRIL